MRDHHVAVRGAARRVRFDGKSRREHEVVVRDPRLARTVKRCQELPGYERFQDVDDAGVRQTIDSADVNAYLRDVAGDDFTASDLRTWAGTVLAALALPETAKFESTRQARRNITRAIERVARQRGNTPAISRKCSVLQQRLARQADALRARRGAA